MQHCRELLGDDCPISDDEIEVLRDQLYLLAETVLEIEAAASGEKGTVSES